MTWLRPAAAALLSSVGSFLVINASGCGSDAVGVDACREIERARCEAGKQCNFVDDVEACKRFYRDQCLHGLRSGKDPGDIAKDECVSAIELAGSCAARNFELLADCPDWKLPVAASVTSPCEAIRFPERIAACNFLNEAQIDASVPQKDVTPEAPIPDAPSEAPAEAAADATGGG